jgi:hypothetical protein
VDLRTIREDVIAVAGVVVEVAHLNSSVDG